MSIWPRPMQREVPITDPRWLASTQPDREPEPKPDVHWLSLMLNPPRNACGAPGGTPANTSPGMTTCPGCLDAIVRTKCLEPDPEDRIGLGIACKQKLGADGTHEGLHDWQKVLTSPLDEQERLQAMGCVPVRVPGAALGDVEAESGASDVGDAAEGSDREADLDRVTAAMGITLLPWQRQYLLAVMNGESVVMSRGRRMGWTTVQRVAKELQKERR